jgi:LuxR family maltose regulon positive regulatory protein
MVALSMQSCADTAVFIQNFSARHAYVLDYLVEEVLERQSPHIQTFLLQTSVLERMTASLCDAVTQSHNSQEILNHLDQANLFLIPLDDERRWYRYHHLFADLLQNRLKQNQPDLPPILHRRASEWFAQANLPDDAIAHALTGGDMEWAAAYIEQVAFDAMLRNREVTLSGWLKALPQEQIRKRPWLCIVQAYIQQWLGLREEVETWLQCAEQIVKNTSSLIPSASEKQRFAGSIASVRGHNALISGDVQAVVTQAKIALKFLPTEDPWHRSSQVALGGAYWALGDRDEAEKTFAMASADGKKVGDRLVQVTAGCYAATQQVKKGQFHAAFAAFRELKAVAVRSNGRPMPVAGMPMIRMGDLLCEWNTLAQAREMMDEGVALCVQLSQSDVLTEAYINQARLCLALGDRDGAWAAIQEAAAVIAATPVDLWLTGWLDERRLRYWLLVGDVDTAVHWANTSGLTIDDELSYHHDLHHINLARVLVAQGRREPAASYLTDAQALLARLLTAAERAGWVHETIKILILQAMAQQAAGKLVEATAVLSRALSLAEPGGYVRLFMDEGEPMRQLLQRASSDYARRLLAVMEGGDGVETAVPATPSSLIDPLSQRELDVLRLLNTHLSSAEIAQELFIAPSTVRSHIKNIYSKLDVHSRAEAVVRAEVLHLL